MKFWRTLLVLLCLATTVCLCMAAEADPAPEISKVPVIFEGTCGEHLTWTLDQNGLLTISGTGPMYDYESARFGCTAPWDNGALKKQAEAEGLEKWPTVVSLVVEEGVTKIGSNAFWCSNIRYADLADTVTVLGDGAFGICTSMTQLDLGNGLEVVGESAVHCINLLTLTLPERLKTIDTWGFRGCGFSEVVIPASVTSIGDRAFEGCANLTGVTLQEGALTTIGEGAFQLCGSLQEIRIPACVTTIGTNAFFSCDSLQAIVVDKHNPNYSSDAAGVLFTKDKTSLLQFPGGCRQSSYAIPDTVTAMAKGAFSKTQHLEQLIIPGSLQTIPAEACKGSQTLRQVTVQEGVLTIGDRAFAECKNLTNIQLPGTVKKLNEGVFSYCTGLESLVLPEGLEIVGYGSFMYCTNLANVVLPSTVTQIVNRAFYNCNTLRTLLFLGDAPTVGNDKPIQVNKQTMLYYYAGKQGWTHPTWNGYPTCPILGDGGVLLEDGYYQKQTQRLFHFEDKIGNPLTHVQIQVNDSIVDTGAAAEQQTQIMGDPETIVRFTREGYWPAELPLYVLSGINTIRFYPLDHTEPFVQAAYGTTTEQYYYDLIHDSLNLTWNKEEEISRFYLNINWCGQKPGVLNLYQPGGTTFFPMQQGLSEPMDISKQILPGLGFYLQAGGTMQPLNIRVIQPKIKKDLILGKDLTLKDLKIPGDQFDLMNRLKLGLDLNDTIELELEIHEDQTFSAVGGLTFQASNVNIRKLALEIDNALRGRTSVSTLVDILHKESAALKTSKMTLGFGGEVGRIFFANGTWTMEDGEVVLHFTRAGAGYILGGEVQATIYTKPYYDFADFFFQTTFSPRGSFYHTYFYSEELDAFMGRQTTIAYQPETDIYGGVTLGRAAYVGPYDSTTFNVEVTFGQDVEKPLNIYKSGEMGIRVDATVWSFDFSVLEKGDVQIWPDPGFLPFAVLASEPSNWKLQPRNYLDIASPALLSDNTDVLANEVYPMSDVQLSVLEDGRQLAVWTEDPGRETRPDSANRTMLYYAVNHGSGWTTPAPVEPEDDGTADFRPLLQEIGGEQWLFWQNASRPLTDQDNIKTAAAAINIRCARFDKATAQFVVCGQDLDAGGYDGEMAASLLVGKPVLVWTSNSEDDMLALTGQGSIHRSCWDGSTWSEPETMAENMGPIDAVTAYGHTVWFSANDGADQEIWHWEDGVLTQLTDNDAEDSKPVAVPGSVLWYGDGKLIQNGQDTGLDLKTDRIQYLRSTTGAEAVLYVRSGNTLCAAFCEDGRWGQPVTVAETETVIGSFSGVFSEDGTITVLIQEKASGEFDAMPAVLRTVSLTRQANLLLESVDYVSTSLTQSGDLTVYAAVQNLGTKPVRMVQVELLQGDTVLSTQICGCDLPSGGRSVLFAPMNLGTAVENLTVRISALGTAEQDPTNNTQPLILYPADISLEETKVWHTAEGLQIAAMVANRGAMDLQNIALTLTDEEEDALQTTTVTALAAGENTFVTFLLETLPKDQSVLTLRAESGLQENVLSNNERQFVVPAAEAGVRLQAVSRSSGEELLITAVVENRTSESETGTVFFASYDDSGKMLQISAAENQIFPAGSCITCDGKLWAKDVSIIKVFVVDPDKGPLTKHVTPDVPVQQ